jgi:hypothetical protein
MKGKNPSMRVYTYIRNSISCINITSPFSSLSLLFLTHSSKNTNGKKPRRRFAPFVNYTYSVVVVNGRAEEQNGTKSIHSFSTKLYKYYTKLLSPFLFLLSRLHSTQLVGKFWTKKNELKLQ